MTDQINVEKSQKPTINILKVLGWLMLIVIITEWFNYFYVLTGNFYSARQMGPFEQVLRLAILFSPLMVFLLMRLALKNKANVDAFVKFAIPFLLITLGISNWIFYYVFGPFLYSTPDFNNTGAILWLILDNLFNYWVLIPCLYYYLTDSGTKLAFNRETNLGLCLSAIYFICIFGGITGIALRFAIISFGVGLFWLLSILLKIDYLSSDSQKTSLYEIRLNLLPVKAVPGILLLICFWITVPIFWYNFVVYEWWIWIPLICASIITEIMFYLKKTLKTEKIGLVWIFASLFIIVLLILTDFIAYLMPFTEIIIVIGLFLLGICLPCLIPYLKKFIDIHRESKVADFKFHLGSALFGIAGFLIPLYIGYWEPITNIFGIILFIVFTRFTLKNLQQKNSVKNE